MTAWMRHAACRDMDPSLFFPKVGKSNVAREAIEACARCPVREPCDLYAAHNKITSGVWGARLRQARGQAR